MDMGDNSPERSGFQKAYDAARAANAAARIAKAAMTSGAKGAAAETAKSFAPLLFKIALCVLILILVIPMAIFTALPNVFFGFSRSANPSVTHMTAQAMEIGSVCMSMEEFQNTVIDSIVTAIVNEYEQQGIVIDRIEVVNNLEEDDLLWFISFNSVANRLNLDEISIAAIRELCADKLSYRWSLFTGRQTVLTIVIDKINPEVWMERLGFDEEARTWAQAFFETLRDSDALEKYAEYYADHAPSYEGDHPSDGNDDASGEIEHGHGVSVGLDISGFVNPSVKNNRDLATYAIHAYENGWGYVWGTFGNVLTPSLFQYKLNQYPRGVGNYEDFIREHWVGRRTSDCIGLIKGYGWLDPRTLQINYGTNGMPDYGANQMCQTAKNRGVKGVDYGDIGSIPEIPGLGLWAPGHAGVYIGGGYAIEAMGTKYGVVRTRVTSRNWKTWYKIPSITYY